MNTNRKAYDDAIAIFKKASADFRAVEKAYRARIIHDEEYLAARRVFAAAQEAADRAERAFNP